MKHILLLLLAKATPRTTRCTRHTHTNLIKSSRGGACTSHPISLILLTHTHTNTHRDREKNIMPLIKTINAKRCPNNAPKGKKYCSIRDCSVAYKVVYIRVSMREGHDKSIIIKSWRWKQQNREAYDFSCHGFF